MLSLRISLIIRIILVYNIMFRKNALRGYEPNNLDYIHKCVPSMKLLETYVWVSSLCELPMDLCHGESLQ